MPTSRPPNASTSTSTPSDPACRDARTSISDVNQTKSGPMKIGILQTGHFAGALEGENPDLDVLFRQMLDGHGFDFSVFPVVDMVFPDTPRDADGWLITGSKFGVYDNEPFIAPLEDFVRAVYAEGVPMVGICFGHQLIAQALGGKVVKFPGGWTAGRELYDFGGETFALNAWHQDQVIEPPADAEVIAAAPRCAYAGLLYGGRALTVQAHPEFQRREVEVLIDVRGPHLPPDLVAGAAANLDAPVDNARLADRIAAFFKVAHG